MDDIAATPMLAADRDKRVNENGSDQTSGYADGKGSRSVIGRDVHLDLLVSAKAPQEMLGVKL
jgi:hypothetical protein